MGLFAQTLISGLFLGLIYGLVAAGLSLIWGIMKFVNFAHGEFLMLGMYFAYWNYQLLGIDPIFSFPLVTFFLFLIGLFFYRVVVQRIINAPSMIQILCSFGVMSLLQGIAQYLWRPDYRVVEEPLIRGTINLFGTLLGKPQFVAGIGSALTMYALLWLINKTEFGFALQATGQNRHAAALVGIDSNKMFMLAWGIGLACVGIAGSLLATYFYIFPSVGRLFGLYALVIVALGGFGSIKGAFLAGCIIGIAEITGGTFTLPSLKTIYAYLIYLPILLIRPHGLFGRKE